MKISDAIGIGLIVLGISMTILNFMAADRQTKHGEGARSALALDRNEIGK